MEPILDERANQVAQVGAEPLRLACHKPSTPGAVSQRACTFCGSRVVLYPIADALHLVHGPIGCAAYTWDIRGALSSGPELHRLSFSTDLAEKDIVFGGERKLAASLRELIPRYQPKAAFVYATCVVGLIGDDVAAICRAAEAEFGIPVITVQSEGFRGTKKDGYRAACDALLRLVGSGDTSGLSPHSINLLGDFNLAGEIWMLRGYYERMGLQVVANITGDGRVADIQRAHGAALNLVQCSGSTLALAKEMKERYGIPFCHVSYCGLDDTAAALYAVAEHFQDEAMAERARTVVREEVATILPELRELRAKLSGKRAAIYVGGAFKAISLVKQLRQLGMQTVLVGSQTGGPDDYALLAELCDPGTVIVDDSNPLELAGFLAERSVDLFIGGVKERPIAYKLGVAFCDHNHERKRALEGFAGALNFGREVAASVLSPVWQLVPRRAAAAAAAAAEAAGKREARHA